ncbi:hypothetical protein [Aestuariivirga sp.]|uniref:phage nozzle protein n=1 Tax=Aestuariivirga sp. TaxID=2650926 RepID=UPI0039E493BD
MPEQITRSLIQGVSQQSPLMRRDSQCEELYDAINSVVYGVIPRPPFTYRKYIPGFLARSAWVHGIFRSKDERYFVSIDGGVLKVFRVETGLECSVTLGSGVTSYLAAPSPEKNQFKAITVEDTTFIINKTVEVAMDPSRTQPTRPYEALVYFKAGGYKLKYSIALKRKDQSTIYKWGYETADASVSSNEPYASPSHLAATFYRAMEGTGIANAMTVAGNADGIVGGDSYGWPELGKSDTDSDGNGHWNKLTRPVGTPTLASLGYHIQINGTTLRIWRDDDKDFDIDGSDGNSDHLIIMKDFAQKYADLPRVGYPGMILKVRGEKNTKADDYWVKFENTGRSGTWVECPAPGVKLGLDPATMPLRLINTSPGNFLLERCPLQDRVCGDGIDSAKEPSFVGKTLTAIGYDDRRLVLLHSGGAVWSKTKEPYTWWPDTAKTELATDPIDYDIAHTTPTSFDHFVLAGDGALVWSQKAQFNINSGDQSFKTTTVGSDLVGTAEYETSIMPIPIGKSLMYCSTVGDYTNVRDMLLENGKLRGERNVTEHVPTYIYGPARDMAGSDLLKMLAVTTQSDDGLMYVHEWRLNESGEVAQVAWHKWRLPADTQLGWFQFDGAELFALLEDEAGSHFVSMDLNQNRRDPGASNYLTRLDMAYYVAVSTAPSITVPFPLKEEQHSKLVAYQMTGSKRGRKIVPHTVTPVGNTTVLAFSSDDLANGDTVAVGLPITTERIESTFYKRDPRSGDVVFGLEPPNVNGYALVMGKTAYTRIETSLKQNAGDLGPAIVEFNGGFLPVDDAIGGVRLNEATLRASTGGPSNLVTIRTINDTPFPSQWIGTLWDYAA